ncbi:Hint domain-containing protein [Paracoccus sp. WLY502]|uniref:Hint domain-containing protein n=1 Tax=Paracoccus yibinensis TaxID=3068891 RepID=UPI002796BF08|nr:Hint domain-containing protein [Paracoccus sp. WLY502]MDQ1900705.1 Hint domain-containing protein [Paracoccus sp. WLY502]
MATVDWMWFGNRASVNATSTTPSTDAEADGMADYNAVGTAQLKAVSVSGDTRMVTINGQRVQAFATTFNRDGWGNDVTNSRMTYASPLTDEAVSTEITGFLSVRYQLTFPDGGTAQQNGVMIQMANGDMFFRPSKDALPEWNGIDALRAVKILSADPYPQNTYVATISFRPTIHDLPVTCFTAGTLIATPFGDRRVEEIGPGDLVMTRDNGPRPVRWTGRRHVGATEMAERPALCPIRIAAGALGPNVPAQDLLVSQQHRILVRSAIAARMFEAQELLIAAKHLTGIEGIDIVTDAPGVTYVHLMFDAHEILVSNGAETESLYPGPQALLALGDAAAEIFILFPQLRHAAEPFPGARPFVTGKKALQLASRHAANQKPLAS